MPQNQDYTINQESYHKLGTLIDFLFKHLGLNLKISGNTAAIENADIMLFNHFTRFETALPPYIIYRATGQYCRSVADKFLFKNKYLATLLRKHGAMPNDHPGLLPFLAADILRGRKAVIFPEGGLVKDKQVMDDAGDYSIYSGKAKERRKHHRGAAVLALTLDMFKERIKILHAEEDDARLTRWQENLGMKTREELLTAANKPTLILPSTITFYPIHFGGQKLRRVLKRVWRNLPRKALEEITVESSLLFRRTDMNVVVGEPVATNHSLNWIEKKALKNYFMEVESLTEFFSLRDRADSWQDKLLLRFFNKQTKHVRDSYMQALYQGATVNINHIAASIMEHLARKKTTEIDKQAFHHMVYVALKKIQAEPSVSKHCSMTWPGYYRGQFKGKNEGLRSFFASCTKAGLIIEHDKTYQLTSEILAAVPFNEIRLKNPILVYANEIEPLEKVQEIIQQTLKTKGKIKDADLADYLFDDELKKFEWERELSNQTQHHQPELKNSRPFLLKPENVAGIKNNTRGVLLVHGFISTPGQLRAYGEHLQKQGFTVLCMRLPGHGTSPEDLHEHSRDMWHKAVQAGYHILARLCKHVHVVGFSTGGVLALKLASAQHSKLKSAAIVAAPIMVKDRNMHILPIMHAINKAVRLIPFIERGIYNFYGSKTNSPKTNYATMPMASINELRLAIKEARKALLDIDLPVLVLQGLKDETVQPKSAKYIHKHAKTEDKQLILLENADHGLMYYNQDDCWQLLDTFMEGKK